MKITFVGNFEVNYSSENHHANSLEKLGYKVIKLQEGEAGGEEILETALDSDLLIFVHTHGWETSGIGLDAIFRILKKAGVPTMTYHLDLWLGIERQKDLEQDPFYKTIEHFFATDKLMADWFNDNTNVKGHYIPAGVYDEEVYFDNTDASIANDIIFVGSKGYHHEWQYRPQLIEWLKNTYKDKFTHIGGDGDTGTIRGDKLNKAYGASKIAIGDTLCINFDYPYYFSDRLFESTGRGGFTIFPYIKGIEDNFEIDKEIVTYKFGDFEELKQKIDYYLTHDKEREQIRKAGFERTKKDHTYLERWRAILKETLDLPFGDKPLNYFETRPIPELAKKYKLTEW